MGAARPAPETAAAKPQSPRLPLAPRIAVLVKLCSLTLALCASAVLFIDYKNAGDPAFCGVASGCFAVRVSAYSHLGGIPLPNLALPAFALLLGGAILAHTADHHRLVAGAAGVGGLVALVLISIQAFFVGAFCPWCVIVDSSALLAGTASILLWFWIGNDERLARQASLPVAAAAAWGVSGALAVALPFVWALYPVIPPAPPEIQAEQQAGKITIVSFTDFECPFCRKLHPLLDAARQQHPGVIHFVRKMKPLSGHPGAMPAARAWVCAPESKRDEVAAALYAMEPASMTDDKIAALGDKLALGGREAFAACMKAEATTSAIERDSELFSQIHGRGLPLTWVNGRVIIGLNPERLSSAIEGELGGPRPALPVAAMFALLAVAALASAVLTWRQIAARTAAENAGGGAAAA